MKARDRITDAEFETAMATPLVFAKDDSESEDECMKRVQDAIRKARPTAAPAKDKPAAPPPSSPTHRHHK